RRLPDQTMRKSRIVPVAAAVLRGDRRTPSRKRMNASARRAAAPAEGPDARALRTFSRYIFRMGVAQTRSAAAVTTNRPEIQGAVRDRRWLSVMRLGRVYDAVARSARVPPSGS